MRLDAAMSARKKLVVIFVILCAVLLGGFFLWGQWWDTWLAPGAAREFFENHGPLAGGVGVGLLIVDLVLPIPSSAVIGGLGAALGVLPGFLWGWLGLVLSGLTGYGVARLGGKKWANRLASPEEQDRFQHLFDTWGGLALVSTRLLPILPEVLSVLAGLYRMHFSRFLLATLLGSIPPALVYAWLGATAVDHPGPAIWGLVAITVLAWLGFVWTKNRMEAR